MDQLLEAALAPVLRDVAATTEVRLNAETGEWSDELGPYVWIAAVDGGRTRVQISTSDTAAQRIAAAAEQVQELVIEEQWARASNWPMCPTHRSTHPLEVAVISGEAWWTCPADHSSVSHVGTLHL